MRSEWYAALASHFDDRGLELLATVCRSMATRHAMLAVSAAEAGLPDESFDPWPHAASDLVFVVACPRRLLEAALVAEEADLLRAEELCRTTREPSIRRILEDTLLVARANIEALVAAVDTAPAPPEWDQLMKTGIVPALVLGAERRMRR